MRLSLHSLGFLHHQLQPFVAVVRQQSELVHLPLRRVAVRWSHLFDRDGLAPCVHFHSSLSASPWQESVSRFCFDLRYTR